MKVTAPWGVYLLLVAAIAGCAGATTTQEIRSASTQDSRPAQIFVYPFAVNPSEVTLNQSVFQRVYRNVSGENQDAQQSKIAHETAEKVCLQVVTALTQKGYAAICQKRGEPVAGSNVLVVDGRFTEISEGNRLRRLTIGLGAGASVLDATVQVYQRTDQGSQQLMEFTTHADSGKMPGAGILGPAGAAAGAAATVGANAAAGGVKATRSTVGALSGFTAQQIIDSLMKYYGEQGWTS